MMNKDLSAAAAFELYQVGLIDLAELDQLVTETIEVRAINRSPVTSQHHTCDAETFAMNNEGMVTPDGVECTAELLQYVWEEGHAD